MNLIRKIAWAVLLGTSSVLGASQGAGALAQRDTAGSSGGCWLYEEELDDPFGLDDEFEGEGWSFWGD